MLSQEARPGNRPQALARHAFAAAVAVGVSIAAVIAFGGGAGELALASPANTPAYGRGMPRPYPAPPCGTNYSYATATATIVPGTTDTGNHCDDCITTIALPFGFQFYDQVFNSAVVNSNGNLHFVGGNPAYVNV